MRTAAVATAVAGVLALSGCVSTSTYPDGDDAVIEVERQRILDLTWQNLGAVGFDRPTPQVTPLAPGDDWSKAFFDCASEIISGPFGYGFGADAGYDLQGGTDDETRVALYNCLASLPLDPFVQRGMRSPEQIDYLYDFHQSWLIPCLESLGIEVTGAPTRAEFAANGGQWDPYPFVRPDDVPAALAAEERCGVSPAQEQYEEEFAPDYVDED